MTLFTMPESGQAVFSTGFGKISPRVAPSPSSPMIVRTEHAYDQKRFAASLRRDWPEHCSGMLTSPVELEAYFDDLDIKLQGPHFLQSVLEKIVEENIFHKDKFEGLAEIWRLENPRRVKEIRPDTEVNVLFRKSEISERGEEHFTHLLKALKDTQAGWEQKLSKKIQGKANDKSESKHNTSVETIAGKENVHHHRTVQPIVPQTAPTTSNHRGGNHHARHSFGGFAFPAHTPDGAFYNGFRPHHRNCQSEPSGLGMIPRPYMLPQWVVHPPPNEYTPFYGLIDSRQYPPFGVHGLHQFMLQPPVCGPYTQHGLALMQQAGYHGAPNAACIGAPLDFSPPFSPMPLPIQAPVQFQGPQVRPPARRVSGRHAAVQPRTQHTARHNPQQINYFDQQGPSTFQQRPVYSNDARVPVLIADEYRQHENFNHPMVHGRPVPPHPEPTVVYMTDAYAHSRTSPTAYKPVPAQHIPHNYSPIHGAPLHPSPTQQESNTQAAVPQIQAPHVPVPQVPAPQVWAPQVAIPLQDLRQKLHHLEPQQTSQPLQENVSSIQAHTERGTSAAVNTKIVEDIEVSTDNKDPQPRAILGGNDPNIHPTEKVEIIQTIHAGASDKKLQNVDATPAPTIESPRVNVPAKMAILPANIKSEEPGTIEMQRSLSEQLFLMKQRSPQDDSAAVTICVGNLSESTDEASIRKAFKSFGQILKVDLPKPGPEDESSRGHRGFGYVQYAHSSDANIARSAMNGTTLDGQMIEVNRSQEQHEHNPAPVKALSDSATKTKSKNTYTTNSVASSVHQLPLGDDQEFPALPKCPTPRLPSPKTSPKKSETQLAIPIKGSPGIVTAEPAVQGPPQHSPDSTHASSTIINGSQSADSQSEPEPISENSAQGAPDLTATNTSTRPKSPLETLHKKSDSQATNGSDSSRLSYVSDGFNISGPMPVGDFPRMPFTVVPVKNPVRVSILAEEPTYHSDIGSDKGDWDGNSPSRYEHFALGVKKHPLAKFEEAAINAEDGSSIPTVSLPSSQPGTPVEQTFGGQDGETLRKAVSPRITEWLGKTDVTSEEDPVTLTYIGQNTMTMTGPVPAPSTMNAASAVPLSSPGDPSTPGVSSTSGDQSKTDELPPSTPDETTIKAAAVAPSSDASILVLEPAVPSQVEAPQVAAASSKPNPAQGSSSAERKRSKKSRKKNASAMKNRRASNQALNTKENNSPLKDTATSDQHPADDSALPTLGTRPSLEQLEQFPDAREQSTMVITSIAVPLTSKSKAAKAKKSKKISASDFINPPQPPATDAPQQQSVTQTSGSKSAWNVLAAGLASGSDKSATQTLQSKSTLSQPQENAEHWPTPVAAPSSRILPGMTWSQIVAKGSSLML